MVDIHDQLVLTGCVVLFTLLWEIAFGVEIQTQYVRNLIYLTISYAATLITYIRYESLRMH